MLMIRFQRIGRTNDPAFRIVLLEKTRAAKAGNITEQLGTYNPRSKALTLDEVRVKEWIAKGAQPTGSIHNLLVTKGIITSKKVNVLQKHTPQKNEKAIAAEAAAAATVAAEAKATKEAAAAPAVETPVAEPVEEVAPATEEVAPTEEQVIAEALPDTETPVVEEAEEEAAPAA
jgi:small subunit ribosomal protein S16